MKKLMSGRWILTVLTGIAFLYVVIEKTIPSEAAVGIMVMVFQGYFSKRRPREDQDKG